MIIILPQVKIEATDHLMVKAVADNSEASHREAKAKDLSTINANFRTIGFRKAHIRVAIINTVATANPPPTTRVIIIITSISTILMISRLNSTAHPVAYAVVLIIPLNTATKENMI